MDSIGVHRPRNVDWRRAAGLLYGDWGTSKAYVIGAAFFASGFASLPMILAVCALTALVAYNYTIICRHFPDGGGVYSAARSQSRLLAVVGALMLVADLTVTASLSAYSGLIYLHVPKAWLLFATIGMIVLIGALNSYGPKHSGTLALGLCVPMVVVVVAIIGLSLPHLTTAHLEKANEGFTREWTTFVSIILALSGVESIANMTGVMKLDPGSSMDNPKVSKTAGKAIFWVALEVCGGTALLGWAMNSLSHEFGPELHNRWEDMLNVLAEKFGTLSVSPAFGQACGIVTGIIVGLLLLSAVNTAVGALIGLFYMMARDGEMPRPLMRLNSHGVPLVPLAIAITLPVLVLLVSPDTRSLMDLYAIGVVGAIVLNLGSCILNKKLGLNWREVSVMFVTFTILVGVEFTLAKTKPNALFFIVCILVGGLTLRSWSQRRAGLRTVTVLEHVAATVAPEEVPTFKLNLTPGQTILVAARGITPVLRYAMEEAQLRQGTLYVLYVKELAVTLPGPLPTGERPRWQDDKQAAEIMYRMADLGQKNGVTVVPLYTVSENPASTILDMAATLGVDILALGSAHRNRLVSLLKGDVVTEVARNLPENIQLVIYG
jgi:amino acid transporter/nucleotide-binding universal stress UspA family protein